MSWSLDTQQEFLSAMRHQQESCSFVTRHSTPPPQRSPAAPWMRVVGNWKLKAFNAARGEPERWCSGICRGWKGSYMRHCSFKHKNAQETGLGKSSSSLLRVSCYRYKCRALRAQQRAAGTGTANTDSERRRHQRDGAGKPDLGTERTLRPTTGFWNRGPLYHLL